MQKGAFLCVFVGGNRIGDLPGDCILALQGQLGNALRGDEGDNIRVNTEARTGDLQIVGNNQVGILLFQLGSRVFYHILCLHRESA